LLTDFNPNKIFTMKKVLLTLALAFLFTAPSLLADPPGPPGPGGDPGGSGGVPVGSPIDGGLGILLAMGISYGGFRLFKSGDRSTKD
jgi:hypothetical protein